MTSQPLRAPRDHYYDGVPDYMTEVYDWAYVDPRRARLLDRNLVVRTLLFGNDQRLMRAYLDAVRPGMRVWQVAHVYGDLVRRVADKVGRTGRFWLTDITPVQVEHGAAKLAACPQAEVWRADAASFTPPAACDLICSFFLLHEVPDDKKRAIVDHLLARLPDDGTLLFVDYHKPAWWQPIGWLLRGVNAWLEPFAHALWRHDIAHFASRAGDYDWRKRTLFGGVYQVLTVTRRQAD